MSNLGQVKRVMAGTTANQYGGLDTIHQMTDIVFTYVKATADSMATDATSAVLAFVNPYDFPLKVVSGRLVSAAALTAHDTNNAVISFRTDDGADSTPAIAISWTTSTTGTGSWVADIPESGTITAANAVLAAGACLHFGITKGSSGVIVPVTYFSIRLQRAE
jgi:hypothetical protein